MPKGNNGKSEICLRAHYYTELGTKSVLVYFIGLGDYFKFLKKLELKSDQNINNIETQLEKSPFLMLGPIRYYVAKLPV